MGVRTFSLGPPSRVLVRDALADVPGVRDFRMVRPDPVGENVELSAVDVQRPFADLVPVRSLAKQAEEISDWDRDGLHLLADIGEGRRHDGLDLPQRLALLETGARDGHPRHDRAGLVRIGRLQGLRDHLPVHLPPRLVVFPVEDERPGSVHGTARPALPAALRGLRPLRRDILRVRRSYGPFSSVWRDCTFAVLPGCCGHTEGRGLFMGRGFFTIVYYRFHVGA